MSNNEELKHYGILGMKWGVRRYQNEDGTLTRAGKRRARKAWSDDAREVKEIRKKKLRAMSNAELRKVNERKNLERNYKTANPNAIKRGAAIVGAVAGGLGTIVGIQKNGTKIIKAGKIVTNKIIKKWDSL